MNDKLNDLSSRWSSWNELQVQQVAQASSWEDVKGAPQVQFQFNFNPISIQFQSVELERLCTYNSRWCMSRSCRICTSQLSQRMSRTCWCFDRAWMNPIQHQQSPRHSIQSIEFSGLNANSFNQKLVNSRMNWWNCGAMVTTDMALQSPPVPPPPGGRQVPL